MKITVFIPTKFHRHYILEAFESIYKQTRHPDEVILVRGSNQADQMNQAVKMSTGDAFIYLADDDLLTPTFIERHEKLMEETGADIVTSALEEFGLRRGVHQPGEKPFMCCLIKKSLWEKVGGFPAWPDGQSLVDGEFFHKCLTINPKIERISDPLWQYRIHSGQTPITNEQTYELAVRNANIDRNARLQL